MPKVSIVIPCYNAEKYLDEAITSALDQTWQDIEVIVVNDGSTDNSLEIMKSYEITYVDKKNGGIASALNSGIKHSTGDWVHWLSADDKLYDIAIELMFEEIQKHQNPENNIYYTHYDIIDKDGNLIKPFIEPITRTLKTQNERFQELLTNYYGNGSCSMIHKSVFEKRKYDESIPYYEDYDFWLNCMKNKMDMVLIPYITMQYRRHPEQMTKKVDRSFAEVIRNRYR